MRKKCLCIHTCIADALLRRMAQAFISPSEVPTPRLATRGPRLEKQASHLCPPVTLTQRSFTGSCVEGPRRLWVAVERLPPSRKPKAET